MTENEFEAKLRELIKSCEGHFSLQNAMAVVTAEAIFLWAICCHITNGDERGLELFIDGLKKEALSKLSEIRAADKLSLN